MKKIIRHGDVSFREIEQLPEGLKVIPHDGEWIVERGKTTGHAHRVRVADPQTMTVLQDEKTGRFYLKISSVAIITHEEHKTLVIQSGIYEKSNEREYDYFGLQTRRVVD